MSVERRVLRSGKVVFRGRIYFGHRVIAEKSFERRGDAKAWEADQLAKLRSGQWIDPGRGRVPFATVAGEWQESRNHLAARSQETTQFLLDSYILPTLGKTPLSSLSANDVERTLTKMRSRDLAPVTQRRALSVIRLVLDYAIRDRRLSENVARAVVLPRGKTRHEPRWLRASELRRLADTVPPATRDVVLFLGLTGCRFSEMAALQVGDVVETPHGLGVRIHRAAPQSKRTHAAVIGSTKTHQTRTVPIPAPLMDYVLGRSAYAAGTAFLFPSPRGTIWTNTNFRKRSKWSASTVAAGVPGTRIHDLRHTAASLLIAGGADVKVVQAILGHASATMTMDLYGHLFSDAPWVAMEKLPSLDLEPESGEVAPEPDADTEGPTIAP